MDSKLILVVIGVIAVAFDLSEAITCYECDSDSEPKCLDPFKPDGVKTCTNATTCTKLSGSDTAGEKGVSRECSDEPAASDLCEKVSVGDVKGKSCVCKSDKCNDGQMVKPTLYNVIIGVAMATVVSIAWMNQS